MTRITGSCVKGGVKVDEKRGQEIGCAQPIETSLAWHPVSCLHSRSKWRTNFRLCGVQSFSLLVTGTNYVQPIELVLAVLKKKLRNTFKPKSSSFFTGTEIAIHHLSLTGGLFKKASKWLRSPSFKVGQPRPSASAFAYMWGP